MTYKRVTNVLLQVLNLQLGFYEPGLQFSYHFGEALVHLSCVLRIASMDN